MSTTPQPDTLTAALAWHAAGASVVRVATDGTKRPLGDWKNAQSVRATDDQLHAQFSGGHPGLGVVMGAVSGGLEMFEFEGRAVAEGIANDFNEIAEGSGLGDLWNRIKCGYCDRSPSGGIHVVWRVVDGEARGNTKLAARPAFDHELTDRERQVLKDRPGKVFQRDLIETRGEGGQSVMAPSHGPVHDTGQPWQLLAGSPATVAEITADERDALFAIARMLDQMPEPGQPAPATAPASDADAFLHSSGPAPAQGGISPLDDYEQRTTWADILKPHGWQQLFTLGHTTYWRRPGKTIGVSATTGRDPQRDRLYVFTSSTEFTPETSYTKPGAYALLEHGGNHSAAAKELRRRGYGSRPDRHLRTVPANTPAVDGTAALKAQPHTTWHAPEEPPVLLPAPMPARDWDDLGNAERVIDRYGSEIRWLADIERWAYYAAGRWTLKGANTGVWTRVVDTVNQLDDEAPNYSGEPVIDDKGKEGASQRDQFLAWSRKQRMRPKLAAAREVLQAYPAVHSTMDAFDKPEMLLNVANGIVDLTTGQLQAHDRGLYLMQQSPICYQPDATCPMWDDFLASVMPDEERRAYLARVVGYSLTGATSEQVMFIHHGEGQNGKGVFMRVTMALLGDYAQAVPGSTLMAKHNDGGIPNDIARMVGKRLLSTSETGRNGEGRGKKLDEELVKRLTGEDVISARFLNAEFFDFRPVGKIHLATNHLPDVSGSHSMARRLQDIGWDVIVPPAKRIPKLDEKIIAREAAGVLNWAIRGCLDWQKQGLAVPESVKAKTREHIAQSNPLATWLEEKTDEVPDAVTENSQLYESYTKWADKAGIRQPLSMKAFTTHLQEKGYPQGKDSRTRRATTLGLALAVFGGDR
ncbi:phage/plasmid primase, P4 family [Streptomyces sp. NPDC093676]|uniref:phage/plasmid primase, P4 family n=1 Tax=Streptomyces sp. NPDC093676 TaxID=3366050 RepID=UPI003805BB08